MKKEFQIKRFEDALFKNAVSAVTFRRFQSQDYVVRHLGVTKVALSAENDKVYMVSPYASRPLGHCKNRLAEDPVCEEWALSAANDEILEQAQLLVSRGLVLPPVFAPVGEEEPLTFAEAAADEDDD